MKIRPTIRFTREGTHMAHWLVKSEPVKYSWDQMVKDKRTHWDGVHNYQAALNMKAMKEGDRAFFYHSNEGKEIVGVFAPDRRGDKAGRSTVAPEGPK